eukprot:3080317-Pyramimonas_sp.AAC.1
MLGCEGLPTCYKKLAGAESRFGHRLSVAMTDQYKPLVFCLHCGACTQKRCKNLHKPCPPAASHNGQYALQRIRLGLDPRYVSRGSVGPARRSDASAVVSLAASAASSVSLVPLRPLITNDRLEALRARVAAREQANSERHAGQAA